MALFKKKSKKSKSLSLATAIKQEKEFLSKLGGGEEVKFMKKMLIQSTDFMMESGRIPNPDIK